MNLPRNPIRRRFAGAIPSAREILLHQARDTAHETANGHEFRLRLRTSAERLEYRLEEPDQTHSVDVQVTLDFGQRDVFEPIVVIVVARIGDHDVEMADVLRVLEVLDGFAGVGVGFSVDLDEDEAGAFAGWEIEEGLRGSGRRVTDSGDDRAIGAGHEQFDKTLSNSCWSFGCTCLVSQEVCVEVR